MKLHLAMLVTDWLIYALAFVALIFFIYMRRLPHLRDPWRRVLHSRTGMVAAVILAFYVVVGLADSIHFQVSYPSAAYSVPQTKSLIDIVLANIVDHDEKTYSAPFATHAFSKSVVKNAAGEEVRGYARLRHAGSHLKNPMDRNADVVWRILLGLAEGLVTGILILIFMIWMLAKWHKERYRSMFVKIAKGRTYVAWREIMVTFMLVWMFIWAITQVMYFYHIFGTDKVGRDVFYASIKSIRTGLLIGTLTTVFMLPFALILGMMAGYFGGWIDDIIQYIYTTLSSIPGVLLISAVILVMQVYIGTHPNLFPTLIQRADARLLALCMILGITSWASLCRLLRAETLKLRELEFVQAAKVLGVGRLRTIFRHIMPNVMHIVLITIVLDFSMLVLAEAVLSYVGVGVDPTTFSWGNMINTSRLELAREPIVWWPLCSALIFMFLLVLSANLFSDAVRDALDPRIRETEALPAGS